MGIKIAAKQVRETCKAAEANNYKAIIRPGRREVNGGHIRKSHAGPDGAGGAL